MPQHRLAPAVCLSVATLVACANAADPAALEPVGPMVAALSSVAPMDNPSARNTTHTCAVTGSGTVVCWGENRFGQLGDRTTTQRSAPVAVVGLTGVRAVAVGGGSSCAVMLDGTARCWGSNAQGQLGDGTTAGDGGGGRFKRTPVVVAGLTNVQRLQVGDEHACAVRTDGRTYCWGNNSAGQLGTGDRADKRVPTLVAALMAVDVQPASTHTCAIRTNGTVACWGNGMLGSLGNRPSRSSTLPVTVAGLDNVVDLSTSLWRTCVVKQNGQALCFGLDLFPPSSPFAVVAVTPTLLPLPGPVSRLQQGLLNTCAIMQTGQVTCWGLDLSTGANSGLRNMAVAGAQSLTTGLLHTCAGQANGAVSCWGFNGLGGLGTGNTLPQTGVVAVPGVQLNGSVCGNGVVEPGEACEGGACCSASCQLVSAGTECRASAGVCDVAEACTGTLAACPGDALVQAGTECRASTGVCDVAEACTGTLAACPGDALVQAGTECRASAGACDVAEACTGTLAACPGDALVQAGTECRASAGACDVAEACTGTLAACPGDALVPSGTECRASAGVCDVAEACTGTLAACPGDALVQAGTECRASAGVCDVAEACTGTLAACPGDALVAAGIECRAGAGACDVAEACTGTLAACPGDALVQVGTECRASAGVCDVAEACTGTLAECPGDGLVGAGTECRASAGACDVAEACTGTLAACPGDAPSAEGTPCNGGICHAGVCVPQEPAPATCGNGVMDVGEECDGEVCCTACRLANTNVVCRNDCADGPRQCTGAFEGCPACVEPARSGNPNAHGDAACAVPANGVGVCWSSMESSRPQPGFPRVRQMSAGNSTVDIGVCAVTLDGTVLCDHRPTPDEGEGEGEGGYYDEELDEWVSYEAPVVLSAVTPVVGLPRLVLVQRGDSMACGLDTLGQPWCWSLVGAEALMPHQIPDVHGALDVTIGGDLLDPQQAREGACAAGSDGRVTCWNDDMSRLNRLDLRGVSQVALTRHEACVLRVDGRVWCWGRFDDVPVLQPLDEEARAVSMGSEPCALLSNGTVKCWEAAGVQNPQPLPPTAVPQVTQAISISGSCAGLADGRVQCWNNAFPWRDGVSWVETGRRTLVGTVFQHERVRAVGVLVGFGERVRYSVTGTRAPDDTRWGTYHQPTLAAGYYSPLWWEDVIIRQGRDFPENWLWNPSGVMSKKPVSGSQASTLTLDSVTGFSNFNDYWYVFVNGDPTCSSVACNTGTFAQPNMVYPGQDRYSTIYRLTEVKERVVRAEVVVIPGVGGVFVPNPLCGNGELNPGETCEPSADQPCCSITCSAAPATSVCRQAQGACDAEEFCSGTALTCPDDALLDGATVCRPEAGACDAAEVCSGASLDCPLDAYADGTRVCREAQGLCDAVESCTGASPDCPEDNIFTAEQQVECRPRADLCDAAERCDGTGYACPALDALAPPGTLCRTQTGACDQAERCVMAWPQDARLTCPPRKVPSVMTTMR